jgi:hypothetical protein
MKRDPRYLLLPKWIRFFSWIFFVAGFPVLPLVVVLWITNWRANFMLFGFNYFGTVKAVFPLVVSWVFIAFSFAAYTLLWGKREGRKSGLICGYFGLVAALLSIPFYLAHGAFHLPLEPLIQVPFIIKLHRLKGTWEQPNHVPDPTPPSVTPPAGAGGAPSVGADH